jgi:hypothetical protein
MKRGIILIIALIAILTPYSCEDIILSVNCQECYSSVSNEIKIEIKISLDKQNSFVPITLYRGDIDKGEIIYEDTAYSTPYYSIPLELGHQYSAVAKYSHDGRIIYAVDGRELKTKYDNSSCDVPCYIIKGDVLDLRLK